MRVPDYFLIAVSNKENLKLCMEYMMAGFPNSLNGVWAFCDIEEGDYVSFLYAAHIYGLYRVSKKVALAHAEQAPPWKPLIFRSGRTYCFPFRLMLEQVRELKESLIRSDFAYVAENLLLRGGYAKTHFQADQTTLQAASQMGSLAPSSKPPQLDMNKYGSFTPRFTLDRGMADGKRVFPLREVILQMLIRKYLSNEENLSRFLDHIGANGLQPSQLEVLGEKALPEGHVDILVKERVPIGRARVIVVEVKIGRASIKDFEQVKGYGEEMGDECAGACLIASRFPRSLPRHVKDVKPFTYNLEIAKRGTYTIRDLLPLLSLQEPAGDA